MTLDDEGAEAHAVGEHQPTAADYASQMKRAMVRLLENAGHAACEYLDRVSYDPASGMVICGCGVFELWQQEAEPDAPPWESGDGPIGDGAQGPGTAVATRRVGGHDLPLAADPIQATLALIDPTQIYTPEDVERHILEVLHRLETGALFERETVEAASATEMAFTRKFNAAVDASEQSAADRRKAEAMVKADAEYEAMMQAKMVKEAVKQTMHNLRAVLSGYQSTARSVGSAYQAGGSQGAPSQRDGRPW